MEKYNHEYLSKKEIENKIKEELNYRMEHGNTFPADENLCKYCRNIDKQNKFCWDCNSGSKYTPITRPLFNLYLMYFSSLDGLESAKMDNKADNTIIIMQQGFIEALKFVLSPFGSILDFERKYGEKVISYCDGCPTPEEIMIEETTCEFKQMIETKKEKEYREKIGTIRPDKMTCNFCKYSDRFGTQFCWDCSLGSNFKNGIRSIDIISKMLMRINTIFNEYDEEKKLGLTGFAEGLKWIIEPYTTENELIEKYGFSYITEEDINSEVEFENDEYRKLDNY